MCLDPKQLSRALLKICTTRVYFVHGSGVSSVQKTDKMFTNFNVHWATQGEIGQKWADNAMDTI